MYEGCKEEIHSHSFVNRYNIISTLMRTTTPKACNRESKGRVAVLPDSCVERLILEFRC